MRLPQPRANHLHLGGGLFESHSRRQPADDLELIAVANGHRLGPQGQHRQRPPQPGLAARQLERPRHDADDQVLFAGNRELLAEHRLGSAEPFAPEALAQHDDAILPIEFLPRERAADEGGRAEELEELRADQAFLRALRRVESREGDLRDDRAPEERHRGEGLALLAPVHQVGHRRAVPPVLRDQVRVDGGQLARPRIRQRPERHRIQHAEHRHARGDADAQDSCDRNGEQPIARKAAEAERHVAHQIVEPAQRPDVAAFVLGQFQAADQSTCSDTASIGRRVPAGAVRRPRGSPWCPSAVDC